MAQRSARSTKSCSQHTTQQRVAINQTEFVTTRGPLPLVKLLGWDDGSKSYTRVIVSLLRWKAVLLTYHDSWRDNSERRWNSRTFNMLDEVTIYSRPGRRARDSGNGQGALPFSSFLWSEAIFKSFEDGYLKNLDFRKYKGPQHPDRQADVPLPR